MVGSQMAATLKALNWAHSHQTISPLLQDKAVVQEAVLEMEGRVTVALDQDGGIKLYQKKELSFIITWQTAEIF